MYLIFDTVPAFLIQCAAALVVIVCCTRILSGRTSSTNEGGEQPMSKSVELPYWVPYIGHTVNLLYDWRGFLRKTSKYVSGGVLSLHILGQKCHIIFDRHLTKAVSGERASSLAVNTLQRRLLVNVYGSDPKYTTLHDDIPNVAPASADENTLIPTLNKSLVFSIEHNLPDLISFSESPVDQHAWERLAEAILTQQTYGMKMRPAVSVDLISLLTSFTEHILLSTLWGREFTEISPSFPQDILDLDSGWKYLALGFPRGLPIPPLNRAYAARRRLLNAIRAFHRAIDVEDQGEQVDQPWRDLSDVSPWMKTRRARHRAKGIPDGVSAADDLALIWSLHAKITSLACWMVLQIWAADGLADQIRREIAPYAQVTQKPQVLAVAEPLQLSVDVEGLLRSCPQLKRCFLQCERLYCPPISIGFVREDFTVLGMGDFNPQPKSGGTLFEKGTYVVCMDTAVGGGSWGAEGSPFRNGSEEDVGSDADSAETAEDEGRSSFIVPVVEQGMVEKVVFSIVAGSLALWDFSPPPAQEWQLPQPSTSSPVGRPRTDIRGIISQRHLSE